MVILGLSLVLVACQSRDSELSNSTELIDKQRKLSDKQVAEALIVSPSGTGLIKVGMTIDEAEAASRMDLAEYGDTQPITCRYVKPIDEFPELSFMTVNDRIVRVDLNSQVSRIVSDTQPPTIDKVQVDSILSTRKGIGLGSSQLDVEANYPNLKVMAHKYIPDGYYLTATSVEDDYSTELKLIFETDGVEVIRIRAGQSPEVDFVEGCS